jgi:hypothetical protein
VGKRWTWVAWVMSAVFIVGLALGAILSVANGTCQRDAASQVMLSLGFTAFMAVGALIVAYRSSNTIGWIFSAIALLAFTGQMASEYAIYAYVTRPGSLPGAILAAWYSSWPWYRHTTPEMAVRVAAAIQERLVVVVQIAEAVLELDDSGGRVF